MSAASGRARAVRSRFTCSGCRLGAQQQSPLFQGNRLDLGAAEFAGTLLGPEATPVWSWFRLGRVVSLHLGGGVWCLFNWIVVASIFKQNCCFL